VAYDVSVVPERYRDVYMLNPLAAVLQAFRWSVLGVGEVPWNHLGYSAATAFAVFVAGAYFFKRMEKSFADII
jgi:lipopolysaccharide transport system permease protein